MTELARSHATDAIKTLVAAMTSDSAPWATRIAAANWPFPARPRRLLSDVHGYGVDLFLHQQGVDTTTPSGKALFQMMGVFSEFERAMIRERVLSGLARAKADGKALGRPTIDPRKEAAIKANLRAGRSGIVKLAGLHGVGVSTVQRIKASLAA